MTVEQVISSLEAKLGTDTELLLSVIELIELASSLKPIKGDEIHNWSNRKSSIIARCGNCDFIWLAGHMPMNADRLNQVTTRLSICSRCGETERVLLNHVKLEAKPRRKEPADRKQDSPTDYCTKNQTRSVQKFATSRADEISGSDVDNIFLEDKQAH